MESLLMLFYTLPAALIAGLTHHTGWRLLAFVGYLGVAGVVLGLKFGLLLSLIMVGCAFLATLVALVAGFVVQMARPSRWLAALIVSGTGTLILRAMIHW